MKVGFPNNCLDSSSPTTTVNKPEIWRTRPDQRMRSLSSASIPRAGGIATGPTISNAVQASHRTTLIPTLPLKPYQQHTASRCKTRRKFAIGFDLADPLHKDHDSLHIVGDSESGNPQTKPTDATR